MLRGTAFRNGDELAIPLWHSAVTREARGRCTRELAAVDDALGLINPQQAKKSVLDAIFDFIM